VTITGLVVAAASSTKPLPGVFHALEPTLKHYGYFAVAGVLLVENCGIPLPGEAMLIAAALYAGTGRLNIWLVAAVAVAASIAGAFLGYVIGARGGRRLAERYGRVVRLTPERLDRVQAFFERRGGWLVVFGRYVDGVRQFLSIIVGISDMTFQRFAVFTTIGAVVWCATWSALGYLAGNHVETVSRYLADFALALFAVTVITLAIRFWRHRRRRTA
jgi:membrane protein DedA with SNARE-associated domain